MNPMCELELRRVVSQLLESFIEAQKQQSAAEQTYLDSVKEAVQSFGQYLTEYEE